MSASELLGLPGVGKSHVLMSFPEMTGVAIQRGWSIEKLFNLLTGLWFAGFSVFLLLVYLRINKRISGQEKLMLVLYERLGRAQRLNTNHVIDEGVMQALWGILWRSQQSALVEESATRIVALLRQQIGIIRYIRCRRDVHLARLVARYQQHPGLGALTFVGDERYQSARSTMAFMLQLLRYNGIRLKYFENTDEQHGVLTRMTNTI